MRRSHSFVAAFAVAALALAPSFADARAGSGGSMGSRGGRSYSAPPSTNTAPMGAQPFDRSMAPRAAPSPGYAGQPVQVGRSGFGSGLMGGLAGGLLGVGLGSLLMGNGFGGGGGGGFFMLLIQMALLFFVGRWLFRMFMRRQQGQPAMAGMPSMARMGQQPSPMQANTAGGGMGAATAVTVSKADYEAFDRNLHEVQAAWTAQDLNAMRGLVTPEMVSYFSEQLADQSSRGLRNSVTHVKLEQGDLAEAWSEGGREYATVAMRFSMLDVTRDSAGRIVDGDVATRSMATELWTFMRASGGHWMLSAIQQTR
jgi:predicted lipid-binding transport protein (Tim44 family)